MFLITTATLYGLFPVPPAAVLIGYRPFQWVLGVTPGWRQTLAPLTSEVIEAEADEVTLPVGHTWMRGDIGSDPALTCSARLPSS